MHVAPAVVQAPKKPIKEEDDVVIVEPQTKSSRWDKTKELMNEMKNESRGSITPPIAESTDASPAIQAAPKRSDWDMFAEQDIDSNFDVSANDNSRINDQLNIKYTEQNNT